MSAEATIAVMEHAEGTDAEWRLLAILANSADHEGVVSMSREELAEKVHKTEKSVGGTLGRLKKSGQLMELEHGGGRGKKNVYWLNLPGIPEPALRKIAEGTAGNPENDGTAGAPPTGNGGGGSNQGEKRSSSEKAAAFMEGLRDCEVPDEMQADALSLLRREKKVGSQLVTPEEMACACAALAAFNRLFEWKAHNGLRKGASFGIGAALTSIVQRIRERPSWDPATHVRLVESAWRLRWWEAGGDRRRPTPNVIYGPKAFEQVVQDATDEKEGAKQGGRHYTRRDRS
jgi:hypothetical protein